MKILNVNKFYFPVLGGVEKITQEISESLNSRDDFEVEVLTCKTKGKRIIENINGIKVYRAASLGKKLGMPISFDFLKLFIGLQKNYEAILIHHPFPLAFLILPFIKTKKLFIWYHSDIVRQKYSKYLFNFFINYGLKKANKILLSGQAIIDNSRTLKNYQEKCVVIPFGIDLEYFSENEEIKNKAAKINAEFKKPLILSVGRLVKYKGFKYLIAAMKNIAASLIIIGEGPLKNKLEKEIIKNQVQGKVKIMAPVNDLRPFYKACDIFVLPSCGKNEAFGLVQIEAMAYRKPIINTNLESAVKEISLNNISGLTVSPRNSAALEEAIKKLIGDEKLREGFGQEARARVEKIFNKKIFIQKLIDTLKSN